MTVCKTIHHFKLLLQAILYRKPLQFDRNHISLAFCTKYFKCFYSVHVHVCTVGYALPNGNFNYSCSKIIKLTTHVKK